MLASAAPPILRSQPDLTRCLRLFQAYRFLSTSYLFVPVFLLFFSSRGLSLTEITLLNTVYSGTLILFEVPTGVLADRCGRKWAMVLGSSLMAAGCLLDWAGHSFVAFAVGEGLLALGMTLSSGADSAYLYDLLRAAGREGEYRRWEGSASAAKLVGTAVALAVGGWLARRDVSVTYLATAAVCVAATLLAALLKERPVAFATPRPLRTQIVSSAHAVLTHPPLLFAVLFSTLVFTLVRMSLYLHQPYLTRAGFAIEGVGLVLGGLSLVGAWGAHGIDRLRRVLGERGLVVGVPAALALSYLVLGQWVASWGIALLLVQSVLNGVYSPLSKELLNREILDSGQRATILSVESMARRLAFGLFAPLCGAMMDRYGLGGGLHVCAALGLVGVALLLGRPVRRLARRRSIAERAAPLLHR
jgi:predicted MFS family arabinose efflux permease